MLNCADKINEHFLDVRAAIEDLRPRLKSHGGDCEFVNVEGTTVFVRLSGACSNCQLASLTVSGLQERLSSRLGRLLRIVPVGRNAH